MSKTATTTPEWESLKHAAERTGFSEFTFREMVADGRLPAYRINDRPGSAIRVKTRDVDALFKPFIPEPVAATRGDAK